ncbi:hypothetical protein BGAL_0204g00090 [Botrytis galanthina]|uniref:Uncharacterized protein n=1 Tax=Botrytis galanthina TaxID=278940 RepID=A0A4S8QZY4_9HELO|nr:hypothetical protein BGAL_0204g00090 [Botrytis galanthina]
MAYQRPFNGAVDKAIPDAHRKVDEATNTGKDQETENTGIRVENYTVTPGYFENTGIRVENYTVTPGYFGPYASASISPVLSPQSIMFEWHKERRRVPATVDKVLIKELQVMYIAIILKTPRRSAFAPRSSILNGRLQQKFLAQKRDTISKIDRK